MTIEHLDISSFLNTWEQYPGLIPVSINNEQVIWQDVGKYHFYEGFFHKSLNNLAAIRKGQAATFSTDIDVLQQSKITESSLTPTGFIFHMGRCGSTLLTKVLGSSSQNHIISEAAPLNHIFSVFTKKGTAQPTEEHTTLYKNLLLALARKRVDTHENCFVKFSSYNVHFARFIRSVFPDVPSVFITRDTEAVVSSFEKKQSAWMHETHFPEIKKVYQLQGDELPQIINGFTKEAKNASLKQIDYKELKPENIMHICSRFNYTPDESDLDKMKKQFSYDSKVEFNKQQFER